jgi:Protein kinase domain/Sulfatase-modifying factor enzyme 1
MAQGAQGTKGAGAVIEISGYTVKREVSVGLLASVYLARQNSLDREVALKVLSSTAAADPALTQRFAEQARLMAALSHPNIVAVYDVGSTSGDTPYFSMQFLSGGDYEERVRRGISEQELTETLTSIARALGYIHNRGLAHRGLAPTKILYDANASPMLTDFGIAVSAQESHLTSAGFAVGNTHYMSPEQARGGEVDARSDIYSLGVLCYYGLTGKPPYDGADGFAIAYAHVFEPIPRLPPSRAHWQQLIDDALAKDPKERYARVEDFLDALTGVGLDADMPVAVEKKKTKEQAKVEKPVVAPVVVETPKAETVKAAAVETPKTEPIIEIPEPISAIEAEIEPLPEPERVANVEPMPDIDPVIESIPVAAVVVTLPVEASSPKETTAETTVLRPPAQLREPPPRPEKQTPTPTARKAALKAPPTAAAKPGLLRWWPLPVAVLGIALIALAVFNRSPEQPKSVIATTTTAAPVPANSATTPPPPPVPALPADTTPATVTANPSSPTPSNGTAPEASLNILDAAEADALSDTVDTDPSKIPTVVDPVVEAIRLGRVDMASQRLTSPAGTNALERFQFALKIDAKNKAAKQGIVDIAKKYTELADKAQTAGNAPQFADFLDRAETTAKLVPEGQDVLKDVAQRRQKLAAPFLAQGKAAAATWDKDAAKAAYEKALQLDPENQAAREGLKFVATIGTPGFIFHDEINGNGHGPELIILGGAKLAMARHEVTRGEFRRYWNAAGKAAFAGHEPSCRDRESIFRGSKKRNWENPDIPQDDNHPVVCVSWAQAAGYAQWLSQQTGKHYRLPSPAEFDRVASRAPPPDCRTTNIADSSFNKTYDSRSGSACDDGFAATAPVAHFEPAAEGVYDMDGNVRTWVAACGGGAAAQVGSGCRDFTVKGRAWISEAKEPATRSDTFASDISLNSVGIRVVRDIE